MVSCTVVSLGTDMVILVHFSLPFLLFCVAVREFKGISSGSFHLAWKGTEWAFFSLKDSVALEGRCMV